MNINTDELCSLISSTLSAWKINNSNSEVVMLAVDCHPWDGILELSLLTLKEVQEDKLLFDVEEMAAWKFFQFSKSLSSWEPSTKLAKEMQLNYLNASDKKALAKEAFILCAKAMRSLSVEQALSDLKKSSNFKISVANPDTGEEYC